MLVLMGIMILKCESSVSLPGVSPHSYQQYEDVCFLSFIFFSDFHLFSNFN